MKAPETSHLSPAHRTLPRQLVLREGYVEDVFEVRTPRGERCVLALRGWANENRDFFSSLLGFFLAC